VKPVRDAFRSGGAGRPAAGAVAAMLGVQAALVISGPLLARLLGVEDRGWFAVVILVPLVPTQLGSLGVPQGLTYYVSTEPGTRRAVVRDALRMAAVQLVGIVLVVAVLWWLVFRDAPSDVRTAATVAFGVIPALFMALYGVAIVQGLQRLALVNVLRSLPPAIYLVSVVILFVADIDDLVVVTVVWVAGYLVTAAVILAVALRTLAAEPPDEADASPPPRRDLLTFGLKGLVGTVSPIEDMQVDQFIVYQLLSPSGVGLYVVGLAFTNLPRFIGTGLGSVAFPHTARQPTLAGRRRVVVRATLAGAVACTVAVLPVILIAEPLIRLLYGDEFSGAADAARLMMVGGVLLGTRRVLTEAARGLGLPGAGSLGEVVTLTVFAAIATVASGAYGLEGIALGFTVAAGAGFATLLLLVRRGLHRLADHPEAPLPDPAPPVAEVVQIEGGATGEL
jgi:O-antigen/teichoic acid export membrane protein